MPRINSVKTRQLTIAAPDQSKERVIARLGSLPVATYSVSAAANNVDEGSSLTFTVSTANITNGTILRWRIIDRPEDFAVNTGTVTINSNTGTFSVTPRAELLTEGEETFRAEIRKRTGSIIATSSAVTINDTSASALSITADQVSIDEGSTVTFTVTVDSQNLADGTTLYWTVDSAADVVSGSGSFEINSDQGTFEVTALADFLAEGEETFTVSIRSGDIEGPIAVTSDPVTINDTSVPTYSLVAAAESVNEGSVLTFTVTTQGVLNNTTLYWTSTSGDVTPSNGSVIINNNTGTISVTAVADNTTEGLETFTLQLRVGSISGTIVASSQTVTINDTSLDPSITIVPGGESVNEGSSLAFTVNTVGLSNGTTLYWTITGVPEDFGTNSGTVTINSNTGTFSVTPTADFTTEGPQTFAVQIRSDGVDGPVLVTSSSITINDTSVPTYTVTPAANNVNEGSNLTFNVTTQGVANGTTLYWTITGASNADFSAFQGSFTINSNSGSFNFTAVTDNTTEGPETFQAQVRTGGTSGDIVATSSSVTINDTSTAEVLALTAVGNPTLVPNTKGVSISGGVPNSRVWVYRTDTDRSITVNFLGTGTGSSGALLSGSGSASASANTLHAGNYTYTAIFDATGNTRTNSVIYYLTVTGPTNYSRFTPVSYTVSGGVIGDILDWRIDMTNGLSNPIASSGGNGVTYASISGSQDGRVTINRNITPHPTGAGTLTVTDRTSGVSSTLSFFVS